MFETNNVKIYVSDKNWEKGGGGGGCKDLGPREGEQEEKHRKLNIPPCWSSPHIELDYDALEKCNKQIHRNVY